MQRAVWPALALWALTGCFGYHRDTPHEGPPLVEVAAFPDDAPTGLAISRTGRIFVNFPRWWHTPRWSVAEIIAGGELRPYPDARWNTWPDSDRKSAASAFVCVQSLRLDAQERLWILDPANPGFQTGIVKGGPKLVAVDLKTDQVLRVIPLRRPAIEDGSYLNDLCVDLAHGAIYIADSGAAALVVVDLETGAARRVLAGHPLVSDEGITPRVGGWPWRTFFWITPTVHVDGLALSPDGQQLYFHVLNGHGLYRLPTAALRDPQLDDAAIAARAERLATTSAVDGMNADEEGRVYWTALELDAIQRLSPDGRIETVVRDGRIRWPDSIAFHEGEVYFTLSQIHLAWPFNWGFPRRRDPYFLFKVQKP